MKHLPFFKLFLYPFSGIYNAVTTVRNFLYDQRILTTHLFSILTVCVGNLRVGGTGKTPFVEYLISLLQKQGYSPSILSRGYGRKSTGFLKANEYSGVADIGDEPMQYFLTLGSSVGVYVEEKRPEGVKKIVSQDPKTDVIVLDDAFQHRPLQTKVSILLTEFNRSFHKDLLLPAGRLRESRRGALRAGIIVVTKSPEFLSLNEAAKFKKEIRLYCKPETPIYFTRIQYEKEIRALPGSFEGNNYLLLCGIDNPSPFIEYCKKNYSVTELIIFKDHHNFTKENIERIQSFNLPVLTTQKDAVRLLEWKEIINRPVYYVPIKVSFLFEEESFREIFFKKLTS